MTVAQTRTVDWLGIEKDTGHIGLTVVDDLDWSDERAHVLLLQEKLNTYIAFVESGEVFGRLEELGASVPSHTPIHVNIVARFDLTTKASAFLRHATHVLAGAGISLGHRVVPDPDR